MKKIIQEFKAFAMRGNVVDMAVGVIIGGAFGKIVSSLVADIIMPLIGGVNFKDLKWTFHSPSIGEGIPAQEVTVNYGNFIQVTFDFLIIAFSIFLFVKLISRFSRKKAEEEAAKPAPAVPEDVKLLQEIRDLLKQNNEK